MDRTLGGGVLAALVFATLIGCATAEPTPVGNASPTSTPVSTETPTSSVEAGGGNDSVEAPLAAYVSADTTSLRIGPIGDSGQVTAYDYYGDASDDVVAALTQAFGVSPYIDDSSASATIYDWLGFQVVDLAGPGGFPDPPDFFLIVSAEEVSGVPILLGDTGHVGGPLSDIAGDIVDAAGPCTFTPCVSLTIAFAVPVDPEDAGLAPGAPAPYNGTLVYSSGPDGQITSFMTPERRW